MGIFGPSRDQRLAAAALALQPHGISMDRRYAEGLRRYEPFVELNAPKNYVTACFGTIEGARVEAYEYEYAVRRTISPGALNGGASLMTQLETSPIPPERVLDIERSTPSKSAAEP